MSNLETLIQTCIEIGSAKTLETLGVSSGEISQRRARDVYGGQAGSDPAGSRKAGQGQDGIGL